MSDLNVNVEEISPVVRRVRVQVPAQRVSAVADAVYRRLGRTVRLPGYRPGHVPRRVLEARFAREVQSDVTRELVESTVAEALVSARLDPVAPPAFEPEEMKPGQDFTYTARVEVHPQVKLQNWRGLEVKLRAAKVGDAEVETRLERMRESLAALVPVEGRDELQMGDVASISYSVTIEGRAPQNRDEANVRVEPGRFVEGYGGSLAGMKVGESRDLVETLPADTAPEVAGREARVTVTLRGIKRRELPALDDEFARDVAGLESIAELRARVRADMEKQATEEHSRDKERQLVEKLIEANPVEVPPALVDMNARHTARLLGENLGRMMGGRAPDLERLREEMMPRALFDVKRLYLLRAIAEEEKIEVPDADVQAHLARLAQEEGVPEEKVRARYASPQGQAVLRDGLRTEKALALVESAAKITVEE